MTDEDIEFCIHQVAFADMTAFKQLYEELKNPIYRFALSIVQDEASAEDVAQDTFLRLRANAEKYKAKGKPKAWIFTIARHCAISELRQKTKADSLEEKEPDCADDGMEDKALSAQTVYRLLNLLREDEREIVTLHIYGGLKHGEIARTLGLPYEQVRWKYAYALKKLKKHFVGRKECFC